MKLVNPLYYPLAVLAGGIILFLGVRIGRLPSLVVLPLAAIAATTGAAVLQARSPDTLDLDNPELERELVSVRAQAQELSSQAQNLRIEATRLLTAAAQMELLGTVQYACDRAQELPAKVDELARRMQGRNSLLSVEDLQRQLAEVDQKLQRSAGVAHEQLSRLADSLQRNIQLARQGEDARQAQVASLSTLIVDTAGALQELQNKLRTADLSNTDETLELRSLSDELNSFQENVELLVSKTI